MRGVTVTTKFALLLAAAASMAAACNALVDAPDGALLQADASTNGDATFEASSAPDTTSSFPDVSMTETEAASPTDAAHASDTAQSADTGQPDAADSGPPETSAPDANAGTMDGGGTDAPSCVADLQKDENNCGWCGHSCLGARCTGGLCAPTAVVPPRTDLQGLYDMVVGPNEVYFTEWCGPALVYRQTLGPSGALTPLASLDGTCATGIVQYGDTLYYGNALPGGMSNLMSVSTDGGTPVLVAATMSAEIEPMGIDTSAVYYNATYGPVGVYRVDRDGGTPVPLYQGDVGKLVVLDANVYFTVPSVGMVMSVPKNGSADPTVLYSPLADAGAADQFITGDDSNVYWTDSTGVVLRGARDGGGYAAISPPIGGPVRLAVDDKSVYIGGPAGTSVMGVDKDGRNLRTYASPVATDVTAISFDAQYVYYSVNIRAPAAIWRVPK
jgi:hypothetical protein